MTILFGPSTDVKVTYMIHGPKIVSEYDQEIPQSQTVDNPVASRGRAAQPSGGGGGGLKCILLVPNLRPRVCCC